MNGPYTRKEHHDTQVLLACDLDRTVVPDGTEPLSDGAQETFTRIVSRKGVTLVYATGRHLASVESVLTEYNLPYPDVLIADVGTSIYWKKGGTWQQDQKWSRKLSEDWHSMKRSEIYTLLASYIAKNNMRQQEDEKQGEFKLSFYTPEASSQQIATNITTLLQHSQVYANVVLSIDAVDHFGYLDILPASADKLHALHYVEEVLSVPHEKVVYAGDSGNDLEPLTSGCRGIVVNNASAQFKQNVLESAHTKDVEQLIYFARGANNNTNGNYTGGIVEGLQHFKLL